jgi:hypothetical protein
MMAILTNKGARPTGTALLSFPKKFQKGSIKNEKYF